MNPIDSLISATSDLDVQAEVYRPSTFWKNASKHITEDLLSRGVENFRSIDRSLHYFVPTYGSPGNSVSNRFNSELADHIRGSLQATLKSRMMLQHLLNGEAHALADYRVLIAADAKDQTPFLHTFSESSIGNPVEQFTIEGRIFSRTSLNYLLGLCLLKKHLARNELIRVVLEIGGGFGSLGEILSHCGISGFKYINIDIPPMSYVAEYYLNCILGESNVAGYSKTRSLKSIETGSLPRAASLCSWQIEKLVGDVDLFVNFISFQEMEPFIVKNYLSHVVRLNARWVMLRNLRQGKQLQTGNRNGVCVPITSEDYIEMLPSYDLIDINVIPFGYKTIDGFHSEIMIFRRSV